VGRLDSRPVSAATGPRARHGVAREPLRRLDPEPEPGEITEIRARYRAVGVPRVVASAEQVRQLPIDPRVAYLLSRIDGHSTVETLVDITGFEVDEVLAVLATLVHFGAVELLVPR
jgi:hypothetical protein